MLSCWQLCLHFAAGQASGNMSRHGACSDLSNFLAFVLWLYIEKSAKFSLPTRTERTERWLYGSVRAATSNGKTPARKKLMATHKSQPTANLQLPPYFHAFALTGRTLAQGRRKVKSKNNSTRSLRNRHNRADRHLTLSHPHRPVSCTGFCRNCLCTDSCRRLQSCRS